MKSVLISIRPQWCELIARMAKTLEIRKNKPNLETPFKCYIYCTKPGTSDPNEILEVHDGDGKIHRCNGKVFCEFVCDRIEYLGNVATDPWENLVGDAHEYQKMLVTKEACLTEAEILSYKGKWGWHISNLVIYDKPKELGEFFFPPEKFCEKQYCGGCPYEEVPDVYGEYRYCCEWKRPLIRPPQSWCYVEELNVEAER